MSGVNQPIPSIQQPLSLNPGSDKISQVWYSWLSALNQFLNNVQPSNGAAKRANETRTNTVAISGDADLSIVLAANTAYEIECGLLVFEDATNPGGISIDLGIAGIGFTGFGGSVFNSTLGAMGVFLIGTTFQYTSVQLSTNPSAPTYICMKTLCLTGSQTVMNIRWAQQAATIGPTTISKASYLRATQTSR